MQKTNLFCRSCLTAHHGLILGIILGLIHGLILDLFLTADHGLFLSTHLQIGQGSIAKPPHLEQVEETRTGS